MSHWDKVESLVALMDTTAEDTIEKVAAENDVTQNDIIVHHNLTQANLYTGENVVTLAENGGDSKLFAGVNIIEKVASDEMDMDSALVAAEEVGLSADDLDVIDAHLSAQAEQAGVLAKTASDADFGDEKEVIASDDVWEKIAEAHEFLAAAGIDPVAAMELGETLAQAETEEEAEKVASEYSDLDDSVAEKVAEALEYLSDIEGVPLTDLMASYDKEAASLAGVVDSAKDGARKLYNMDSSRIADGIKGAAKTIGNKLSGRDLKRTLSQHGETVNKAAKIKSDLKKGQDRLTKSLKAGRISKDTYNQKMKNIGAEASKYGGLNKHIKDAKKAIKSEKIKTYGTRAAVGGAAVGTAGYAAYKANQN